MNEENNFDSEVREAEKEKIFDIRERTFAFAVRVVKLCQYLEKIQKSAEI